MSQSTRRSFGKQAIGSLVTFSLLETLFECDAFGDKVKPTASRWFSEVNQLGWDLKDETVSQQQWQQQVEALLGQVNLPELLSLVDFDKLTKNLNHVEKGVRSLRFKFQQIEGVPSRLAYGKQIFAFKKGRSVVPHGHNNMATAFVVLQGEFEGRHYDRLKDEGDHFLIKPTIDRKFQPAEFSTVTDFKDNIHWFKATSETGFIFNIHALGVNPTSTNRTGRVYVDPNGERLEGGLIRARRLGYEEAHKLYG